MSFCCKTRTLPNGHRMVQYDDGRIILFDENWRQIRCSWSDGYTDFYWNGVWWFRSYSDNPEVFLLPQTIQ